MSDVAASCICVCVVSSAGRYVNWLTTVEEKQAGVIKHSHWKTEKKQPMLDE
jgi:hypothetical protein